MWAPTVFARERQQYLKVFLCEGQQYFYVSAKSISMWVTTVFLCEWQQRHFSSLPSPAGSIVGSVCHLGWILSTDRRAQVNCHIVILVILSFYRLSYWSYQKCDRRESWLSLTTGKALPQFAWYPPLPERWWFRSLPFIRPISFVYQINPPIISDSPVTNTGFRWWLAFCLASLAPPLPGFSTNFKLSKIFMNASQTCCQNKASMSPFNLWPPMNDKLWFTLASKGVFIGKAGTQ